MPYSLSHLIPLLTRHSISHHGLKLKKKLPSFTSCILCGAQHQQHHLLCTACEHSLPTISHYCGQCGNILSNQSPYLCRYCLKKKVVFDGAVSLFHYQHPIDYCIKQLKFQQRLLYAELLGQKMADVLSKNHQQISKNNIDVIFPVPLHVKRLRQRGFNQALEIARPIAKKLNIPLVSNALIRSRYTQAQTELTAAQRRNNLKGSFTYQPKQPYKNIAIVDDVMTTGSTLHEVSKTLKQHPKVENIYVWICACAEENSVNSSHILK